MSEILYGRRPVLEALRSNVRTILKVHLMKGGRDEMFTQVEAHVKARGIPCFYETRHKLDVLARTDKHQGVVAVLESRKVHQLEDLLGRSRVANEPLFAVLLDGIEDPQNLGAILRSADAAGAHGVVIPKDRSASVTPAASKASAGAAEHVLTVRVTNLNDTILKLKEEGVWVYGADAEGRKPFYEADLRRPCALVIGSEGKGLRRLVRENCDETLMIPMAGQVASLNASVSAALMMFEVVRQRRWGPMLSYTPTLPRYPSPNPFHQGFTPAAPTSSYPPDRSFFRPGLDPGSQAPAEGPDEAVKDEPPSSDLPGTDKGGHFQW